MDDKGFTIDFYLDELYQRMDEVQHYLEKYDMKEAKLQKKK